MSPLVWLIEPSDGEARLFVMVATDAGLDLQIRRFTTGVAAVEALTNALTPPDVIVCPPVLPVVDLSDFVTAARRLCPNVLLAVSNDPVLVVPPWVSALPIDTYIAKPFAADEIRALLDRLSPESSRKRRRTVLVVDDDDAFAAQLAFLLHTSGYAVLSARTGEEAAALAITQQDSLAGAIVDLNLPDTSGLDIIHNLRNRGKGVKIIATTGVLSDLYLEIATYMGAHLAMRKPKHLPGEPFPGSDWTTAMDNLFGDGSGATSA